MITAMWVPKNPPGGWPVKLLVAVASLALVHAAFIGAHHVLDDTSPLDVVYPLDRTVEAVEIQWAVLWGSKAEIEARLHSAQERVHEAEVLADALRQDKVTADEITDTMRMLFNDAKIQSDLAVRLAHNKLIGPETDVSDFSLAIFVESSLEDTMLRVSNIVLTLRGHPLLVQMAENFLGTNQSLLDISDAMVNGFDVSDDIRLTIREQIRREILEADSGRTNTGAVETVSECAADGQECATTADCCSNQGLTCMPFQSSTGFTRRCQRTVHSICYTECEAVTQGTTWSEARRCRAGYIEADMPPCDALVRESCTVVSERQPCWER